MSPHRLRGLLGPVGLAGLAGLVAVSGCGAGTASDGGPTASSPAAPTVLVVSEVRYAGAPTGWADPTLDLYLPADAGAAPVAVIVPDAGADPAGPDYVLLARDLAAGGVVAAVVHWGPAGAAPPTVWGRATEDVVAETRQGTAEVGCALAVAARQAGLTASGPGRALVVVGHGAGANAAAMAALTTAPPFDTCFTPGPAPLVTAALLWDGDWLGADVDDALGGAAATFLDAYSPWPRVDTLRGTTFVEVGVNANRLDGLAVEVGPTSSYLTTRDPAGTMTHDLGEVEAFANGSIDPVDVARAFAVGLRDAGIQSREREVHGEGDPDTLGPRVRALAVQSVLQLTLP